MNTNTRNKIATELYTNLIVSEKSALYKHYFNIGKRGLTGAPYDYFRNEPFSSAHFSYT